MLGEWTAEPTTLAQTTLTMVGVSEIGGSRLTLDELSLGSLTPRLPRAVVGESGCSTTHSRRTSPTTISWQAGEGWREHFHFHTTRLKGFRSPETPHFDLPWNLPDRTRRPPEDEERGWSGSFLYRFLETPRFLRETGGLGKSSGPALLWESRRYQMRMHYIGGRVLRDFYTTAVNAAGGEVVLRERRVGGRRVLDGVLPTRRHLAAVPFGPFWSARIAEGAAGKGLQFWTVERGSRTKERWKFQDATGREIYSPARETKADFSAARSNATGRRLLDTPPPPNPEMPKTRKSTLRQKSHDTTHKLGWGVSSGPAIF